MNRLNLLFLSALVAHVIMQPATASDDRVDLNSGWRFLRMESPDAIARGFETSGFDDSHWESVRLPHTPRLEPLVVNDQWQGICWYRKTLDVPAEAAGRRVILELEGAMSQSQIWINGQLAGERMGGYLPVVVDITDFVSPGGRNVLAIRLDNRDNPLTGPKPLKRLDFCTYGGLYRNAWLSIEEPVHISHPVLAKRVAGGGVFITTPVVAEDESVVRVKTHVVNEGRKDAEQVEVKYRVYRDGMSVTEGDAAGVRVVAGGDAEFVGELAVSNAKLWSPREPNLYTLEVEVIADGVVVDREVRRFGIRQFEFRGHELFLNGEKIFLRGVNRHQEYPYIGYALSDNAQYRDARKIKEAGFDFIRLSHYPHSEAFMDACDELGIVTLPAIAGWQYYLDDDRFRNYCYRSAAELIRRDRNHPCVLAWEVSLNETKMPVPFMQELHRIAHAEFPGRWTYTSGWIDGVYDIFLEARQHRILHGYHEDLSRPYIVSEYGDWEYYSSNAGLNQHKLDKTRRYETSSRQRRGYGERRLLQQAANVQEAHNDNFRTSACADGYWVMFDYNRGYHDDIEFSGVMDIFRLPKFVRDFYRSQRDPKTGAVVSIASWWTPDSPLDVKVYSNCDEVALYLNGSLIGRQKPETDEDSEHLAHPPLTFRLAAFQPGELRAVGYLGGRAAAEYRVRTPGEPVALRIEIDESGRPPEAGCNDVVFAWISAVDEHGTVVPGFSDDVEIHVDGDVTVVNVDGIRAEAGIATAVLRLGDTAGEVRINATSGKLKGGLKFEMRSN